MASSPKTADSSSYYDGVLSQPFLAEHWYRGFVAAALSLFLIALLLYTSFDFSFLLSVGVAGIFSSLLLVAVVTQHQRFELQLAQKRYRTSLWVLGLRFGEWQPLPPIDSIMIRHWQQKHELPLEDSSISASTTNLIAVEDKWQVLLHPTNSPISLVAAYVGQVQARQIAAKLASLLHVEFYK